MEDVPDLINIGPTNNIPILNQHEIFLKILYVSFNNKKNSMSVLGLNSKDRKSTRDEANINTQTEVVPYSQPTVSQQIVCKFHLDPQYHTFHWGFTILGNSTPWLSWRFWVSTGISAECRIKYDMIFTGTVTSWQQIDVCSRYWTTRKKLSNKLIKPTTLDNNLPVVINCTVGT